MTTKKSSFRGKVSRDAQKTRAAKKGYLNLPDGVKMFSVKENAKSINLDILPYVVSDEKHPNRDDKNGIALPGDLWYRRPIRVHRNVGVNNESIICPKSIGKPCPICEYQKKRYDQGAPKEETKLLYPQDRNLYIVVPLDEAYDDSIQVWDMAETLFQECLKDELEQNPDNEIFPDLEEGKSLEIILKWKSLGTSTFPESRKINFTDRDPYKESILKKVPNLDEIIEVLSYKEIEAKFHEIDTEDGGDLVDEQPSTRKRRVDKDEDEQEEVTTRRKPIRKDEDDDEDEQEEAPPRRRSIRKDEDEPEKPAKKVVKEEEEEEEPSVKRSSRRLSEREDNTKSNKCPYDHKFGVDTEKFDDCDDCDVWKLCRKERDSK